MLFPLLVVLLQTTTPTADTDNGPPASRDVRTVRVWLGSSLLVRGAPVRVYVQTAQDGNLIVLHRRTDGRIEVLFPARPGDDTFVRAGNYEIQTTPGKVAFVVAEPDGSGLVLAALAPVAYRFDEFVRTAAWDPQALTPSWSGADAVGALSDIVQRMALDGYFNYDVATYTVAPPVYAQQAQDTGVTYREYPTCTGCTFIGFQENVFLPLALCDGFFVPCGAERFARRAGSGAETAAPPTPAIALSLGPSSSPVVTPRNRRGAGGIVRKANPLVSAPPASRPTVPTRRRAVRGPVAVAPTQVVRLTLNPTAVREQPEAARMGTSTVVLTGLVVRRPAAVERGAPSPAVPYSLMPRARGMAVAGGITRAGGSGVGGAVATAGVSHGIALPPAVFRGAAVRGLTPGTVVARRR